MIFQNETVNKTVRDLIVSADNRVLAVRAQQVNRPLPDVSPFATVQITLRPPAGWAERVQENSETGEDIDETVCQRVLLRASINYFKNNGDYSSGVILSAIDAAQAFTLFLQGSSAIQSMRTSGIGLNQISEVRNLTALENGEWEERAQLDVDFNVASTRIDLINEIKSVLVTGDYQEHNNEYPVSFTVDENSGSNN